MRVKTGDRGASGPVAFSKHSLPVTLVPGRLLKSLIQNDKMCSLGTPSYSLTNANES